MPVYWFLIAAIALFPTSSVAGYCDRGAEFLHCYHPTAQLTRCEEGLFDGSMKLYFAGITGKQYRMEISQVRQGNQLRYEILSDNAIIPPNRGCSLEKWQTVQ